MHYTTFASIGDNIGVVVHITDFMLLRLMMKKLW